MGVHDLSWTRQNQVNVKWKLYLEWKLGLVGVFFSTHLTCQFCEARKFSTVGNFPLAQRTTKNLIGTQYDKNNVFMLFKTIPYFYTFGGLRKPTLRR